MNDSESPVGGVPSADPLSSAPEAGASGAAAGAGSGAGVAAESGARAGGFAADGSAADGSAADGSAAGGFAAEPEVEIVDGLPVLAEVRTVERVVPAALPAVQVAAVAATGFVAGAATVALVKRRAARKMVRNGRGGPRRAVDLLPIAASRSFLVDVHVIGKQGD